MKHRFLFAALIALLATATANANASTATYRLTIANEWLQSTHPIGYPSNAHFSWFGGGTHASPTNFWSLGGTASPGFEVLAESGETPLWVSEIEAAGGTGLEWRHWFCTPDQTHENCGSLSVTFEVSSDTPFLTLASMLGPSPDWFVGVHDLNLRADGEWQANLSRSLVLYDAGTESGTTPTIENPSNNEPIHLIAYEATSGGYIASSTPYVLGQLDLQLVSTEPADSTAAPTELISRRQDGQEQEQEEEGGANGRSWDPSLSADGQTVAFSSNATNLLSNDANGSIRDIFVFNRGTGVLRNLTQGGNGVSEDPVLSSDGNWLAFKTEATNLPTQVADSNGPIADIVLANLVSGELTLVTPGGNGASSTPSLSHNGQRLAFDTLATNLAAGNYQPIRCSPTPSDANLCYKNVLVYDRVSEFRLNLTQGGLSDSRAPSISDSGEHVAFNSRFFAHRSSLVVMNIETGDRRQVSSTPLVISQSRPYLSANARWVMVLDTPVSESTTLPPLPRQVFLYDLQNDQEYFLGPESRLTGDFSDDERYLVFSSISDELDLPDQNGTGQDIYRLNLSTAPWDPSGPPVESYERISIGGNAGSGGPSISRDGSIIAWDSTASNFADDNNGELFDVFVRDLQPGNRAPSANELSLTIPTGDSLSLVLSGFDPDGDDLAFVIREEPANGSLNGVPPQLTYTPNAGFIGADSFTFALSDGFASSEPALVTILVGESADEGEDQEEEEDSDETPPDSCAPVCAAPLAAVLPGSRSMLMNSTATVFATILNPATTAALACRIELNTRLNIDFEYRSSDPLTNLVSGAANPVVDIPPQGASSFVLALTPREAFALSQLEFNFVCGNSGSAPVAPGLNTLALSSSIEPTADVVAIALTPSANGIAAVRITDYGVYAVATVNLGAEASITASPVTGSWFSGEALICETRPITGECMAPPAASVKTRMNPLGTASFGVFVRANAAIPLDPTNNRQTVQFADASGNTRGSTSVALTTAP